MESQLSWSMFLNQNFRNTLVLLKYSYSTEYICILILAKDELSV